MLSARSQILVMSGTAMKFSIYNARAFVLVFPRNIPIFPIMDTKYNIIHFPKESIISEYSILRNGVFWALIPTARWTYER